MNATNTTRGCGLEGMDFNLLLGLPVQNSKGQPPAFKFPSMGPGSEVGTRKLSSAVNNAKTAADALGEFLRRQIDRDGVHISLGRRVARRRPVV